MNARLSVFFMLLFLHLIFLRVLSAPPAVENSPLATLPYAGWEQEANSATARGISDNSLNSMEPSLAFDQEGRAVVAWSDGSDGSGEIALRRLAGSYWAELGGSATGGVSASEGVSTHVSLAIDADGQPVVAWREALSDGNWEIFVKRWSGSAWVAMDGLDAGVNISQTPDESDYPSLAIDHEGRPVVAWTESEKIYVKRWNGSVWEGLAGSDAGYGISGPGAGHPSLAINHQGNPVVAWTQRNVDGYANNDIYLKQWNGSVWEKKGGSAIHGGISLNDGNSYNPSLAIGANGEMAVAWEDDSGPGDKPEIYVKRWNGLNWVNLGNHSANAGGISDNPGPSHSPSLAIVADGSWIVAWADSSEDVPVIYFRRWDGSAWVEMETGSSSAGGVSGITEGYQSISPSLAAAPDGTMMVAWQMEYEEWGATTADIYARRYHSITYGGWRELGNAGYISYNGTHSLRPSAAVLADGQPIVAWQDYPGNYDIYLKYRNELGWVEMAASATAGGISDNEGDSFDPALAVGPDDRPFIAWRDNSEGGWEIYLKHWNGSNWVTMDGTPSGVNISQTPGDSEHPSLAVPPDGRPVVAWVETTTNREIYVARWNGSVWASLGNSNSGGGISNSSLDSFSPYIVIDAEGHPVVAWSQVTAGGGAEIYLRRWDGSTWVEVGGSATAGGVSDNEGGSFRPSLALGPAGMMVVAWEDNSGDEYRENYDIYVKRWNGSAWVEVGTESAAGGGISNNSGTSTWPTLAIDSDGAPNIAWEDRSYGRTQIYFRRFDGSSWVEAGLESGRFSGISGAPIGARAKSPSLVANANGRLFVAWDTWYEEWGEPTAEIVGRYYDLCFPLTLGHTGEGQDPVAVPANSPDCAPGSYMNGEAITLTAAPAGGWQVAGWSGTSQNNSTAATNTLTMPAKHHEAGVQYGTTQYMLDLPVVIRNGSQ